MKIKLMSIESVNFGQKEKVNFTPKGENWTVYGANGTGKTTIYNMLLWLWHDCNSVGSKKYNPTSINDAGDVKNDAETSVIAVFDFDGTCKTFERKKTPKLTKQGDFKGYDNFYFVDGEAYTPTKFKSFVASICDQEQFKLLTDLSYFLDDDKTDQKKKRSALLELAGDIPSPEGFEDVVKSIGYRSVDSAINTANNNLKSVDRSLLGVQANIKAWSSIVPEKVNLKALKAKKNQLISDVEQKKELLEDVGELEKEIFTLRSIRKKLLAEYNSLKSSLELIEKEGDRVCTECGQKIGVDIIKNILENKKSAGKKNRSDINKVEAILEPKKINNQKLNSEIESLNSSIRTIEDKIVLQENQKKQIQSLESAKLEEQSLGAEKMILEGDLHRLKEFQNAQNRLVEKSVNSMFKNLKFSMFEKLIDGERPRCSATLKGVPYKNLSCGEKIKCGLEIVELYSEKLELKLPLFIDNAEGYTGDINAKTQTIKLCASKQHEELFFEKE